MKYIIEDATTIFYGQEEKKSYFIEDSKVRYNSSFFNHFNHMRLHTDRFIITPGHVMLDFSIIKINAFQSFKERMKQLQNLGCTTYISACEIKFENEFQKKLNHAKHSLINSSIDFVIGIKVQLKKLTVTLVRKCCKNKVPIIFVEVNEVADLYSVQWQWIRSELFPYHLVIMPIWKLDISKRKLNKLKHDWVNILTANKITTEVSAPKEHVPLTKQFLLNIGLYPIKGSLQANCDADYLLFSKEKVINQQVDGFNSLPDIVVANGKVKKASEHCFVKPGEGRELQIKVPKRFVPISEAFEPDTLLFDYY